MANDPNQPSGEAHWPAPSAPAGGGDQEAPTEPVVYGHDRPTVPHGVPGEHTAWVPYAPPQPMPTVEVTAPPKKGGRGKVILGVVGVAVILVAGVFAITRIAGGSSGGSSSPEGAVEKLFESVANRDVLGALDSLLPGERDVTKDRAVELVDHLRRLDVLSESADLQSIEGVEIEFSDMQYDPVETNVDDITDVLVSGSVSVSVNGDELPIGDLILDRALGGEQLDINESQDTDFENVMLATVEDDGRWYVSVGYTVAEHLRTGGDPDNADAADIPEADEALQNGADSPEGAMNNLFDAIEGFDLEGIIGVVDPREAGALQRYAPLFIDQVAEEFSNLSNEAVVTFGDVTYDVTTSGDDGKVGILVGSVVVSTPDGEINVDLETACAEFTPADGSAPEQVCASDVADPGAAVEDLEDSLGLPPEVMDAVTKLSEDMAAALDDFEGAKVTVHREDGLWYVSGLGTVADIGLGVLAAIDEDELDTIIDDVEELITALETSLDFDMPG